MADSFVAIDCTIKKGAFSGERVFVVRTAGEVHESLASFRHFLTNAGIPLQRDEPSAETMPGMVIARVFKKSKDFLTVETPDGEVFEVPRTTVRKFLKGAFANVLVES